MFDRFPLLRFDVPMTSANGSGAMFDGIAKKYDLLNRITSMGFDRRWRKIAVASLNLSPGDRLLDLAAGTLDVSIAAANRFPGIQILAADPSKEMLGVGINKLSPATEIQVVAATGESLPVGPQSIHAAIIAFGIRNFTNRRVALQELARTIVPGGRLVILELSVPQKGLGAPFAKFYVEQVIPRIGALLSSRAEYAYLPTSMKKFPQPDLFAEELMESGFTPPSVQSFMSGACHLFICEKNKEKK